MGKFSFANLFRRKKKEDKRELIESEEINVESAVSTTRFIHLPGHPTLSKYKRLKEDAEFKTQKEKAKKTTKGGLTWNGRDNARKPGCRPDKLPLKDTRGTKSPFRDYGSNTEMVEMVERVKSKDQLDKMSIIEASSDVYYIGYGMALVTDARKDLIIKLDKTGSPSVLYHTKEINEPSSVALTQSGDIAVTSSKTKCIVVFAANGEVKKCFTHEKFRRPSGIAVSKNGNFIVTDINAKFVSIFDMDGKFIRYLNDTNVKFVCPKYVVVSPDGKIIVSDAGDHNLKVFDETGNFLRIIGEYGSGDGQLKCPYGVTTDNIGNIMVADHDNNRITLFDVEGSFLCHLMTSQNELIHPQGVALSPSLTVFVTFGFITDLRILAFKIKYSQKNCATPS